MSVLDAKFKQLEQDLGADAYQMLAYLLEFGPRSGILVSAIGTRAATGESAPLTRSSESARSRSTGHRTAC